MAIKYLAGERLIGTAAERLALSGHVSPPQTSWKELGRAEASGSQAEIDVTGFTAKDNLMILVYTTGASNTNDAFINFNNDEDGNYANRYSRDGGTDATDEEQSLGLRIEQGQTTPQFSVMHVRNIAAREKLLTGETISQMATGAATSGLPTRQEFVGKWVSDPLSERITQVTLDRASGTFADGSEVVVLGCDDDETTTTGANSSPTHTDTNFWQGLVDVTLDDYEWGIRTEVFTPKKYLWFQVSYTSTSGAGDFIMQNGNTTVDTGYSTGYAMKYNINGDAITGVSTGNNHHDGAFAMNYQNGGFFNCYAINVADKEKLFIPHRIDLNSLSAGDVPRRGEGSNKWADSSVQINIMRYQKLSSQTVAAGSTFRVWGSD